MYSGVPKKHHLNCGFSVVSYHPHTQEEQTFHLLEETPEDMRYWVHGLRCVCTDLGVCVWCGVIEGVLTLRTRNLNMKTHYSGPVYSEYLVVC